MNPQRLFGYLRDTIKMCWKVQEFSWVGHGVVTLLAGGFAATVLDAWFGWQLAGYVVGVSLAAAYYCFWREVLDARKHKRKRDYHLPQGPGEASSRGDGVGDRVAPAAIALSSWCAGAFAVRWWVGLATTIVVAVGLLVLIWNSDRARDWREEQRATTA